MSGIALYLDCLECEEKLCKKVEKVKHMKHEACIGVDQSYKRTGMSITVDGKLKVVRSVDLSDYTSKTEKRKAVSELVRKAVELCRSKGVEDITCIFERVRLRSQGFLSMDYIQSMSGMNTTIIDTCYELGVKVFSVDTRCWKASVVGTSKPADNKFGVPPEKWPTTRWLISMGREKDILREIEGRRSKGTFTRDGVKYEYDNDAADSAAISMFLFVGDRKKLKEEQ